MSPMPPKVAQKTSACSVREQRRVSPSAVRSVFDRVGEAAVPELAVDVGGDRPADGDMPRPGYDHREPADGQEDAHQHLDAHARLAVERAARGVEAEDAIEAVVHDHPAVRIQCGIAIAAAEAAGDERRRRLRGQHLRDGRAALRPEHLTAGEREPTPATEDRRGHRRAP